MERTDKFCHPVESEEDGVLVLDTIQTVELYPTDGPGNIIACPGFKNGKCAGKFTCHRQQQLPEITIVTKE